ncbi:hypothetical protein [Saccharopolyspora sp. NPDC002376]
MNSFCSAVPVAEPQRPPGLRRIKAEHLPDTAEHGFVIVHRGEDSTWLLVHWWEQDIRCQRLLRSDDGDPFAPARAHLFACVWELHVIDHERRAWACHTLNPAPDHAAYLKDAITVAHP